MAYCSDSFDSISIRPPQSSDATALGATIVNNGTVTDTGSAYLDRIQNSLAGDKKGLAGLGAQPENFGKALGRVIAHETGHYLLNLNGHKSNKLMRKQFQGDSTLFREGSSYNSMFNFTDDQAKDLAKLCPQPKPEERLGGGGGIDTGGGFLGGGGYPWWMHAMWDFANWVRSIPVGGHGEITFVGEDVEV